jgi:membrane-associated phospholipid phosphatase
MLSTLLQIVSSHIAWLALGYFAALYAGFLRSTAILTVLLLTIASIAFCDVACTHWLNPHLASFCLPSVHAADGMAGATIILWTTKGVVRTLSVILALLIGYSRIYLGVHPPTDVLAAFAIGALVGSAVFGVWRTFIDTRPALEP